MDELTITLTADEWNQVLDILGDGPFKRVSPLIQKIVQQARSQQNHGQAQQTHPYPGQP